jgi:hypothetical protein
LMYPTISLVIGSLHRNIVHLWGSKVQLLPRQASFCTK